VITKKIKNTKDVIAFTKQLVKEGINFHPDDDFNDYINLKTKKQSYTKQAAKHRNKLMNQCFAVCKKNNVDIYDTMLEVMLKETGMDKLIPLPSIINSR
jgi:hypothetical protein